MADDVARVLATRVRARRTALGWSQRELGRRAGVGMAAAHRIETGERETWLTTAIAIARALSVPLGDLVNPDCDRCHGMPPPGYQCRDCGAVTEDEADG